MLLFLLCLLDDDIGADDDGDDTFIASTSRMVDSELAKDTCMKSHHHEYNHIASYHISTHHLII